MSFDPTWKPIVGSTVRFLDIADINTVGGGDVHNGTIRPANKDTTAAAVLPFMFTPAMIHLCGTTAVVKEVSPRKDALGYYNVMLSNFSTDGETERFLYSTWMLCDAAEMTMTIDNMLAEVGVSLRAYGALAIPANATEAQIIEIVSAKEKIMAGLQKIEKAITLRYSYDKCTKRELFKVLKALYGSSEEKLHSVWSEIGEKKTKYVSEMKKSENRQKKADMIAKVLLKTYAGVFKTKFGIDLFNREKTTTIVPGGNSRNATASRLRQDIAAKILEVVKFDNSSRVKGEVILGNPVNTAPHDRWNAAAKKAHEQLGMFASHEGVKIYKTSVEFFEIPELVFNVIRHSSASMFINVRHPTTNIDVRALESALTTVPNNNGRVFRDLVCACSTCGNQHGRGTGQVCQRCFENANRNIFNGYHSQNRNYEGPRIGAVRFGIENELHCKDAKANHAAFGIIRQNSDLAIGELDGSLSQYDGEVILCPLPFTNQAMKKVGDFFQTLSEHMTVPDQKMSSTSYGLHINVSGYATETAVRASHFLKNNQGLVETLAGRQQNTYCSYSNINAGTKYSAINIRRNGVAEYRIFRATVDRDTLMMRIQFAIALMEFCEVVTDMSSKDFTWESFKTFAKGLRRSNELRAYLHPDLKKVTRRIPAKVAEAAPAMKPGTVVAA